MGFFSSLVKVGLAIAESPVAVVKDVATLGGALTDQDLPYTAQKLQDMGDAYNEMKESLDDE